MFSIVDGGSVTYCFIWGDDVYGGFASDCSDFIEAGENPIILLGSEISRFIPI
jgi:hypothetical protein